MPEPTAFLNKPAWVDLSTSDPAAARDFYARLFGWRVEVSPDPLYGGYALAKIDGEDVAGIGPKMAADAPAAWSVYVGMSDGEDLGRRVEAAGGTVIAPVFDVGDQGRMAVFQDPAGAFISAWQPLAMGSFRTNIPNAFAWAELNTRALDAAVAFYGKVFGWTPRLMQAEGAPPYTELLLDGERVAGAQAMSPMVPAEVPAYWMVYFGVDDVDGTYARALAGGAHEMLSPIGFPGGRLAIIGDPQGAAFGILKMDPAQAPM